MSNPTTGEHWPRKPQTEAERERDRREIERILGTPEVGSDQPNPTTGEWTTRGVVDTPVPHIRITPQEHEQIMEQLAAAVKALQEVRKTLAAGGGPLKAVDVIDAALAKIGYPLPDGRTK